LGEILLGEMKLGELGLGEMRLGDMGHSRRFNWPHSPVSAPAGVAETDSQPQKRNYVIKNRELMLTQ
jgi:hypothetical protein